MRTIHCLSVVSVAAVTFLLGNVTARASMTAGGSMRDRSVPVDSDTRLAYRPPPPPPRSIKCESRGGNYTYCRTGMRGPVRLQKQLSGTPCVPYDTWGADADGGGVWVWNGCRAVFLVANSWGPPPGHGPGWGPPHGGGGQTVVCKSEGFQYSHCPLGRRRHVRLTKNLSDTRCIRGDNWDVDRRGIWVDRGCAGKFLVE
jgi:hypothetical protein